MRSYDPELPPNPEEWLALDEQERIQLAEAHHLATHVKLPNTKVHAVFHVIVENQVAEGLEPVVQAMSRLMSEGLSRHDALHAIGSVLAEHLHKSAKANAQDTPSTIQARYNAAVETLNAKAWLREFGGPQRGG